MPPVITVLAVGDGGIGLVLEKDPRPPADALQQRQGRAALVGEAVLHPGRDLVILDALHHVVGDQVLQGGGKDGVGDVGQVPAQLGVADGALGGEDAEDAGGPFTAEYVQTVFQRTTDVLFQFWFIYGDSLSFRVTMIIIV